MPAMKAVSLFVATLIQLGLIFHSIGPAHAGAQLGPGRKYTTVERMQLAHLKAVHEDRLKIAATRHAVLDKTEYTDYRAVMHVHASDSPHTGGTREELLTAAIEAGVNIVMFNDHIRPGPDFIDDSWRGIRGGVLFIPGAEGEGFLAYPTSSIRGRKWASRDEYVRLIKDRGGNIFLSHVEEKLDWPVQGLDGIEIYNHHTDVKDESGFYLWLRQSLVDPDGLRNLEIALKNYPQEAFAVCQDYLSEIMTKWDRELTRHRLTGIAANDCHHNQTFTLTAADQGAADLHYISSAPTTARITSREAPRISELVKGRSPGDIIGSLDFDPYDRSLRYVTTHVLAGKLAEADIRNALARGHAYVAHDWLCDPAGFCFLALNDRNQMMGVMGDEIRPSNGVVLKASFSAPCSIRVIFDGHTLSEIEGDSIRIAASQPGVYRIQGWLTVDGEQRPWIYSNPIYVRQAN
jgi:hypothetical protein